MDINQIKPLETKDIDISKFVDSDEPVVITIRHYTVWAKNEIQGLIAEGQEFDQKSNKVVIKNMNFQNALLMKELLSGVEKAPFPWTEKTIKEIDKRNPDLLMFIVSEVEKFNNFLLLTSNENSLK